MIKVLDKRSLLRLGVVLAMAVLVCVAVFYSVFQMPEIEVKLAEKKPTGKTIEEIIKDLNAPPSGEEAQVPEEIIKDLTAPPSGEEAQVPEDILEDLTVPE